MGNNNLDKYEIEAVASLVVELAWAYGGLKASDYLGEALTDLRAGAESDDAGIELMRQAADPISEHDYVIWSVLPSDDERALITNEAHKLLNEIV